MIVLGINYGPDEDPLAALVRRDRATISVYARHRDYHDLIKGRLKQLAGWLHARFGAQVKVFVDTAPVLEKPLAQQAGIGWQGKHTNLVSRRFGSWLFLGEIFTDLALEPDPAEGDHCGSCRACLDVCPTDAFPAPYQLDARRCISYLTIEHQGHIPREFRAPIGNRIYGCDDCLAVCPWNKFARAASEAKLQARDDLRAPRAGRAGPARRRRLPAPLRRLADQAHRARPVRAQRPDRDRQQRRAGLAGLVEERLADPSPLVRAMAVWALRRLPGRDAMAAYAAAPAGRARPRGPRGMAGRARLTSAPVLLRPRLHGAGAGAPADRPRAGGSPAPRAAADKQARLAAEGFEIYRFARDRPLEDPAAALAGTTHVLTSIAPDEAGDPVLDASSRRSAAVRRPGLGGLSRHHRGLRRSRRRLGRRGRCRGPDHAAHAPPGRRRGPLAGERPAGAHLSPGRHLRPRPGAQCARRGARRHRAPDRQAGPGVRPHPRRRHRPGAARVDGADPTRAPSTTSPTTSRRRPRT